MTLVTISSKNQITLPALYLREFGLVPSEKLFVDREDDKITLKPIKGSVTDELANSLTKYVSKNKLGKSWKEIMTETQKIRARHLANE